MQSLENPFYLALTTRHAHLAQRSGSVVRYPANILPVAAAPALTHEHLNHVAALLAPEQKVWLIGFEPEPHPIVSCSVSLPVVQMHLPFAQAALLTDQADDGPAVVALGSQNAADMVALTDVAFPGFYMPMTWTLGAYFGIYAEGQLVAMAGERISVPGISEISAVCTHPQHTGRGYAAHLIRQVVRHHHTSGIQSMLHVTATNTRAIELYQRLGFQQTTAILFHRFHRNS